MTTTTTTDAATGAPTSTSSTVTRVLGASILVGIGLLVAFGLFISPPDAQLGQTIRILYMHVPTVSAAYLAFLVTAVASGMYLWKRTEFWDLTAAASAEIGVRFFGLTIVNGMFWGKITWGVFWRWEPRLTTTAVMFLTYVGYLVVRAVPASPRARATRSAVIGVLAAANLFIVHKAVEWWRGLHQDATVFKPNPQIHGTQAFATYFGLLVFVLLFVWLLIHRFRVGFLAERAADAGLDSALEERRQEAAQ